MLVTVVCSWPSAPDLGGMEGVRLTVERYTPLLVLDRDEAWSLGSRNRTGLADLDEQAEVGVSTGAEVS